MRPFLSVSTALAWALSWSLVAVSFAKPVGDSKTLVLLDDLANRSEYSIFLDSLTARGHRLFVHTVAQISTTVPLLVYGDLAFSHVVILASKVSTFGGTVGVGGLIDYVNAGGNVLLAASSELSEVVRDFAYEFSVDFDESGTSVFDHFNSIHDSPSQIISSSFTNKTNFILSESTRQGPPVVFQGVGHKVTGKNILTFPILTASHSAYSYDSKDTDPLLGGPLLGETISLASAFQARNNARVVFVGSTSLFSNKYAKLKVPFKNSQSICGNAAFSADISKWVFQEKSVVQITNTKHHRVNETDQHGIYRIKDEMIYSATIKVWSGDAWEPFVAKDIQFEAVMLDPYIRKTMNESDGVYVARFTLPDQYGVFSFKLNYQRHGLSYISASETVQVRPFRHNQFPRFLVVAYPYYANIFSLMVAFFLFSAVFLFNKEVRPKTKTL
ncbi:oligosaccharyl transferase glycoprotein complex, beta subunit [Batrachochytrium dendrobatidis]|nr:oligosaccharyl transferase glycoprotein complex, beta subunit [Batrachochytrium dendrobatidis]KAK5673083.1 oligosaccharyl transferase glycoprotein complex, beta subunit [Batrachochytrium dendrobatidis]